MRWGRVLLLGVTVLALGCPRTPRCANRDEDCPAGYTCVDQVCRARGNGSSSSGGASSLGGSSSTPVPSSAGGSSSGDVSSSRVSSSGGGCPQGGTCQADCAELAWGVSMADEAQCLAMTPQSVVGQCNEAAVCVPLQTSCVDPAPGALLQACDVECVSNAAVCQPGTLLGTPLADLCARGTTTVLCNGTTCTDEDGVSRLRARQCNTQGRCAQGSEVSTCGLLRCGSNAACLAACADTSDCHRGRCDVDGGTCVPVVPVDPPDASVLLLPCTSPDGGPVSPGEACVANCGDFVAGLGIDDGALCMALPAGAVAGTCGADGVTCAPTDLATCPPGTGDILASCDSECVRDVTPCLPGAPRRAITSVADVCFTLTTSPACSGTACTDFLDRSALTARACSAGGRCAATADAGSCGAFRCESNARCLASCALPSDCVGTACDVDAGLCR